MIKKASALQHDAISRKPVRKVRIMAVVAAAVVEQDGFAIKPK